ncbi:MAG: hypothetical protein HYR91_12895 [Flavobacteriia bacterium]|nr:hypothetical protein [Flavobacteriia bacterium]
MYSFLVLSQEKQNDLSKYSLNGKVKSIHSIKYDGLLTNDTLVTKGPKKVNKRFFNITDRILLFNNSGFVLEKNDNNDIHEKNVYDDKNNLLYSIDLDSNLKIKSKVEFKYYKINKVRSELWFDADNKLYYKIIVKYKKGKLVKEIEKNFFEKINYLRKYQYDNIGFVNKIEDFENDSLRNAIVYTNDTLGNNLKTETYDKEMKIKEFIENKFNKSGNLISSVKYDSNKNIISKNNFTYDLENHLIEESGLIDNRNYYKFYNKLGDVILSINEYGENIIESFTFIYDEHNNWIKKITYINDKPFEIEEREILYY